MKIIYWVGNGFAPGNPRDVDEFSYASLREAERRRNMGWGLGEDKYLRDEWCILLIPNSVVRDATGKVVLRDTLHTIALADSCLDDGVRNHDARCRLTTRETTGATTDCLALAEEVARLHAERVTVCCTTAETARYLRAMYRGVTRHIIGRELQADFVPPTTGPQPNLKSRVLYVVLWLVTAISAATRPTFLLWYGLLNWLYQHRLRGFERTIS